MIDYLKAILILAAGVALSATPFVARGNPAMMQLAVQANAGGGDLASIKTSMVSFFDADDETDAHGSYDMVETGTPTYSSGTVTVDDSANQWRTHADLLGSGGADWGDIANDKAIAMCVNLTTAANGEYVFGHFLVNRCNIRFFTTATGFTAEIGNRLQSASSGASSTGTDYILIINFDASDTGEEVDFYVDGSTSGAANGGGALQDALQLDFPDSAGQGVTEMDIKWLAFWNRTLTTTEIAALQTEGSGLTYADLP